MGSTRFITIMLLPDGSESGRSFRIRRLTMNLVLGSVAVLVVGILLFFLFYGSILSRAAQADNLEIENERLLKYQYKVKLLEENLIQTREVVGRLVKMAGIEFEFPELPSDSVLFAQLDQNGKAIIARSSTVGLTIPDGLPLAGFVSQNFEIDEDAHFHPGVDLACAEGTPVLATASGKVTFAGSDEIYGLMLVLQHSDSITTVYGHNSELLVNEGEQVMVGSRIALSGNTGKSTAPHLHYEIRINDEPINPLDKK